MKKKLSFKIRELSEISWLELCLGGQLIMREVLSKEIESHKKEMLARLNYIVNEEQKNCKYRLLDKSIVKNELKRFFE